MTPFERYVTWKRADGSPFDPWLRVHHRLGAEFSKIMSRSLAVTGSVPEWEDWTNMAFPESGLYVVPGALQPVTIDRERDEGRYEDPNLWMRHPLSQERPKSRAWRRDRSPDGRGPRNGGSSGRSGW